MQVGCGMWALGGEWEDPLPRCPTAIQGFLMDLGKIKQEG